MLRAVRSTTIRWGCVAQDVVTGHHGGLPVQVDILSWRNKTQRVHTQVKDICAILSGLVVAQDYRRGQALIVNRNFADNNEFFQVPCLPACLRMPPSHAPRCSCCSALWLRADAHKGPWPSACMCRDMHPLAEERDGLSRQTKDDSDLRGRRSCDCRGGPVAPQAEERLLLDAAMLCRMCLRWAGASRS